jgi:ribokinase
LTQLEIPIRTVLAGERAARRAGLRFILDAAQAVEIPDELVGLADVVTANREEAPRTSRIDVHDRESALVAARTIRMRGARCVTVGIAEPCGRQ